MRKLVHLASVALLSLLGCSALGRSGHGGEALTSNDRRFYEPPVLTPSYLPSAASGFGRFNFNWDAKLFLDAVVAQCVDANGKGLVDAHGNPIDCNVLVATGTHPENVQVADYTDLNGVAIDDMVALSPPAVPVLQGAQAISAKDDDDCKNLCGEGTTCLRGPGDSFGTFTVIPRSDGDFLPKPAPGYKGKGTCSSTDGVLFRYLVWVYADQNFASYDPNNPDALRCALPGAGIYRQPGMVVVDTSNGNNPCYSELSLAPEKMDDLVSTTGKSFDSLESSVSADGRFIVMNVHGTLQYTWNPTPANSNTWEDQADLGHLHQDLGPGSGKTSVMNGVARPASDFVPLALLPLRAPDGTVYADTGDAAVFAGAYPWVSNDASELFYEGVQISQNGATYDGVHRAGLAVVGRLTGNVERLVDSFVNFDRGNTDTGANEKTNPRSVGLVPGLWNDWRNPSFALPLDKGRPLYPIFVQGQGYSEVSFDSFANGSDVLYFEMNELLRPLGGSKNEKIYDLANQADTSSHANRTPDISGQLNNGSLNHGVSIPEYIHCAARTMDEAQRDLSNGTCQKDADGVLRPYASGKAAAFTASGALTVASTPTLRDFGQGLSLGFFIRQDAGAADFAGQDLSVVSLPQSVSASIDGNTLTFALECRAQEVKLKVNVFDPNHPLDWRHVALTYKPLTNVATAYLDAVPVATAHCGSLSAAGRTATDPLVFGPNLGGSSDKKVVYWLDQVRVSRVERSQLEIAADARVHVSAPAVAGELPLGLSSSDLQIPPSLSAESESAYEAKVQLGDEIFHDARFSATGAVACSTCHDSAAAFTDPRGVSLDLHGNPLPRSAPSIFNRAFGDLEMWDGAHSSLEAQATAPFLNPNEMGLTLQQLIDTSNANYGSDFQSIYGSGADQSIIADAVAHYVRNLRSGDAPIDEYLAGNTSALTSSQAAGYDLFRGKARCIACHSGSNFTDEQFHRQGFTQLDSDGANQGRATFACAGADAACQNRLQYLFKTPSLRNIALTPPYFHNGSVGAVGAPHASLAAVVKIYSAGPSDASTNHDPVMRPLALSDTEQIELVDFLEHALTSKDNRF